MEIIFGAFLLSELFNIKFYKRIKEFISKKKYHDKEDNTIYFLKFGNNKIESSYRPLILCNIFNLLRDLCYFSLIIHGFDKHKIKDTDIIYFHYKENKDNRKTIIFIHGLGF